MHAIRVMEQALSALDAQLAPSWTLSEELLRPKESSQVYKAEFSQPLCTAVQVMVVEVLRSWGITPAAVLGHSSGEIAAAYASGALTMEEAIICGYLRGRATKQSTETPGAMAAIGLGSDDIKPYLADGVVVACENSPSNTTLSGDEDKVLEVLQAVKHDYPDVIARRLQVDMAYHSHHMKKIGEDYERQLKPYVSSKVTSIPFFSTVTGYMALGESLDATYWRSNLESPVLFNTGVQNLVEFQGRNSVLVEIGPHSALSGPLRQILSYIKAQQALYVPTLLRSKNSSWFEFTISSYDETSNSWAKHCFGLVRAGNGNLIEKKRSVTHLPRDVEPAYWYKAMRSVGLNYGPQFQGLGRISTHLLHNVAVADLRLDAVSEPELQDGAVYYIHPATSDACMQLLSAAAARGQARSFHRKAVPTYIGEAYFKSPQGAVTVEAAADALPNATIVGTCIGVDATQDVVIQLKDVKLTPLDDGENPGEDTHAGGRLLWKPDIDFQDASQLLHSHKEVREAYFRLQKLVLLCCICARDELRSKEMPIADTQPHLVKYQEWISEQVAQAEKQGYPLLDEAEVYELLQLSPEERPDRIAHYLELVLETEYATIGRVVCRVHESLAGILSGDIDGLEILRQDDALGQIYSLGNQWDYGPWLRLLSHRTPHLRVLEIGAGTGATTDVVLRGLDSFYSYAYTDVSAGFFPAAKERFGQFGPRMQFRTLDISADPLAQGFEPNSFDLIVAANVLHVTPKIGETLANVRKLLRPDGRLLLQEMYMTVKWLNFIMGLLPGWWLGEEDGRGQEPYVSPERWAEELLAAGFSSPEASIFDDEVPFQANVTMVASPKIEWEADPVVYLLSGQPDGEVAMSVSASLRNLGLEIQNIGPSEKPQGFVLSILDLEGKSFLGDITPETYARFKDFFCSDPQYSAILGLLRVVRNETGASLCTLELDDTTSPKSWQAVLHVYQKIRQMRSVERDEMADPDCEFAYSGGTVYLPRFRWISVNDELAAPREEQHTYKRLEIGKRGSLKSLRWVERPLLNNLTGEEVYVDIRAVGMNFKDTLTAMGIINGPKEAGDGFGVECSGVVRAIGPDVTDLVVGERVMAITHDAYATTTRTAASRCIKMPDDVSFEEAASMPCVYPTVIHGVINLAQLEKGQSILIHSACGGIGLAAIHICRMVGVDKIYATVGSDEKVQYLIDNFGLPRSHIFSSRDASFLPGVMRETGGRGVDVVLNSLSGELLHTSWKCVAEFGSMVEIGKRDFLGQGRLDMESFEGNRAFFGIEMWPIITKQPRRIRKLIDQFLGYYRTGAIKPIQPIRVFEAADVETAIRTMQKGSHIGKLVVRIPEDTSTIAAIPARQGFSLRSDASYLLVGGLGGLGRSVAMWMVENGAKHFIFLSRSGGKKPTEAVLIQALEGSGCTVAVVEGSVTEIDSVTRAVDAAEMPIAGVVQLSMVLRDNLFTEMPFEDWEAVTGPKIQGTWNLHTALAQQPLDFFVLFSSFAGLIGQRGQANYASASTFLDAFVQFRHGLGLPASVLDVGAVADVGFVAERPDLIQFFKTTSHYFLREQDVLDSFELAIRKSSPSLQEPNGSFVSDSQIALAMRSTIPLSSPQNRNVWRRDARLSLYRTLELDANRDKLPTGETAAPGDDDEDAEIRRLLTAAEADLSIVTQDTFVAQLARRIGVAFFNFMMKPIEELDINAPFASLGIDSLVAIEVRNWLRLRLTIELSLLEIMRSESILALAKFGAKKWASKVVTK
ncbi:hypothetical protein ONZ43_g364 [Nemania bipapillata]|uniref:Uncharacterized protein n=1 Tax=Nemania bipapillata TaxID=110536 RepID=A0ACC2J8T7_9PEZI|nr:hypothetical protein ONZ43_g364 [Nemania bipapillata]